MNIMHVDELKNFFIHFFFDKKQKTGCFVGAFTSEGPMLPEIPAIKSKSRTFLPLNQSRFTEKDHNFLLIKKLKFAGEITEMLEEAWKNHFFLCNLISDPDLRGSYLLLPLSHQEAIKKAYQEDIRNMKPDDPFYQATADFRFRLIKATPWSSKIG